MICTHSPHAVFKSLCIFLGAEPFLFCLCQSVSCFVRSPNDRSNKTAKSKSQLKRDFRIWLPGYTQRFIYLHKGTQSLETRVHMTNLTRSIFLTKSQDSTLWPIVQYECTKAFPLFEDMKVVSIY